MAWHDTMHDERQPTGGLQIGVMKTNEVSISSSRDKVTEIWSMLRYEALHSELSEKILKDKGVRTKSQRIRILSEISAFIDQAENYYTYAQNSDYRSSALLYYYSFMNLAKAAILRDNPSNLGKKYRHGTNRNNTSRELAKSSVLIQQSRASNVSVFNELYNIEYGNYLPPQKAIGLEHIMGYMSDVSDEVTKLLGKNINKIHPARVYILNNSSTQTAWPVIATRQGFYPKNYPSTFAKFEENFQKINASATTRNLIMELNYNLSRHLNYSQSLAQFPIGQPNPPGILPTLEVYTLLDETFGKFHQAHSYGNDESFAITDPLRKNWQVPFNEPLAIYIMMFYLSEIVRYEPGSFNNSLSLSTKQGWFVKSFIESTPYTCLVYLTAKITGNTYKISPR